MKIQLAITFLFFTLALWAQNQSELPLVPVPASEKVTSGFFKFDKDTKIVLNPDNREMRCAVERLMDLFQTAAEFNLEITASDIKTNAVICKLSSSISNEEGYKLIIKKNVITIEAKQPNGVFYALQSVRQLLPPQIESSKMEDIAWKIPCAEIEDAPRYTYRGLMLDCSRHFMPKEFVKQYIDLLAYHKLNKFHWHLTDDQGWRLEIKKYPKLTEVGAFRYRTMVGSMGDKIKKWDNTYYGGFYTQEDIKEIVEYAQKRFVTIIPEIEMPGHATAALAAYPELSCSGGPFEVQGIWGIHNDIFCGGNDEVFTFLEDVLSEVIELFPSEYIHIGGDEAPKIRWERCYACQERMKNEGLENEEELQSYFIKRIDKFLDTKGKKLIGWDEMLKGGLSPNATVMCWRGAKHGINAASQGHDVIMSPMQYVYLDQYQAKSKMEPMAIGGYSPIWHVYSFNPTSESLTPKQAKHVIGLQGNLWTEYIPTPDHAFYMAYPRAAAIAESAWSPNKKKNYEHFYSRLMKILSRYNYMGVNYNRTFLSEDGGIR